MEWRGIIDWKNWRINDYETEVVVKIKFNPLNFLYNFERMKQIIRKFENVHVFPDSPDIEAIIKELEQEEEEAKNKLD